MSGTVPLNWTSVGNASNGTTGSLGGDIVVQGADGSQYWLTVEQGPVWLAQVLYQPPGWLVPALYGLLLVVLAVAGYKVAQKGVDPDALREAADRAVLVGSVLVVGLLLNRSGLFPYGVDVAGTFIGGLLLARSIRCHPRWERALEELIASKGASGDA